MRTQRILVVAACLTLIFGLISPWQWQVAATLGAIFLVLVAIWLRLTEDARRPRERDRERA